MSIIITSALFYGKRGNKSFIATSINFASESLNPQLSKKSCIFQKSTNRNNHLMTNYSSKGLSSRNG